METKICKICGIEKNITEYSKTKKHHRNECKECRKIKLRDYYKKYYIDNKTKIDLKNKCNRDSHKRETKEYNKKYYELNKERIIQNVKKYRSKNKEKLIKKQEEYNNKKRKEDDVFKLKCNIRNMINRSFTRKEYKKNKHTEEIIGCDIEYFVNYLLETFKNNYGYEYDGIEEVHIDHIMPLKYAQTEEEVIKLCNYTNLQLLKAKDNLIKGSKIM